MPNSPSQHKFLNNSICLTAFNNAQTSFARQLIYLPYAGGSGTTFLPIVEHLKSSVEVWAIDAPGHTCTDGLPFDDINKLSALYLKNLPASLFSDNVVLFGHSLGAYIACALASILVTAGTSPILVLSAASPPHLRNLKNPLSALSQDELISVLVSLGGLPTSWATSPELFALFEATLRADFKMYESYVFNENIRHLKTLIIGGYEDKLCLPPHLLKWNKYFDDISLDYVSGSHLFLKDSP